MRANSDLSQTRVDYRTRPKQLQLDVGGWGGRGMSHSARHSTLAANVTITAAGSSSCSTA